MKSSPRWSVLVIALLVGIVTGDLVVQDQERQEVKVEGVSALPGQDEE